MSSTSWAWVILVVAALFETGWAVGMKYTHGFTRLWPSVFTLAAIVISMGLLAYAVKVLPIGTAYAVWVGIGAMGAAVLGIVLFNEDRSPARIFFLLLLLTAIIGLKLTTPSPPEVSPEDSQEVSTEASLQASSQTISQTSATSDISSRDQDEA